MTERIQSVDRAIDLLLAVAAAGPADAGVPALAKACGLNRATAWRLLKTLQARRLVTVDEAGRYALGVTAVELGGAAGPDAVIAAAHPVLERTCAQTGETASLAMPVVGGLTYVDEVTPAAVLTASWLGRTVPLHATSTGKALLAFLPPAELRRVLPSALHGFTDTTITGGHGARRGAGRHPRPRLRHVRGRAGVGVVRRVGTGARPLRPSDRGAVSIWGPKDRVPEQRFAELGPIAVAAAREVGCGPEAPPAVA